MAKSNKPPKKWQKSLKTRIAKSNKEIKPPKNGEKV
jgi:hypothetical protein